MRKGQNIFLPHKIRIIFCSAILGLMFIFLIGRLYYIQIVQHAKFTEIKGKQYISTKNIEPKRGSIYDRGGKELAISVDVDSIYAIPCKIKNIFESAVKLSSVLGIERTQLITKLKTNSSFVWIARKVTREEADRIKELDIDGIEFIKEGKRFYPNGKLANQVIGFAGLDNKGLSGIEFYFDEYIKGEKSLSVEGRDALGRSVLKNDQLCVTPPCGDDIFLTIDKFIQYIAETELEKACLSYKAKSGTIIVQNPSTGEILALANWPTFDAVSITGKDIPLLRNRAITDIYEPGSTFKIITAAAALEEEIIRVDDKIFCENGRYILAGRSIRDHEKEGWLTFKEIIEKSSNIGVAKIGKKIGADKLFSYAENFGFGKLTEIQLPAEANGILPNSKKWSQTLLSRISFGQGVGVTAIQMVSAISCVANKGILMNPYIVESIRDKDGRIIEEFKPKEKGRVITERTAEILNDVLKGVVERGTGTSAAIDGFRIAGKTGTAQKIDVESGRYSIDKYISSFVGYLPADDPKITILVIVDEPAEIHWGSVVCAPAFALVGKEIMRYLNVPPEKDLIIARGRNNIYD